MNGVPNQRMYRRDFQRLALERIADSRALLAANRFGAAYYLAGYAAECALKACIARQTEKHAFPPRNARELYDHDIERLVRLAGLESLLVNMKNSDHDFEINWYAIKEWKSELRYALDIPENIAADLITALTTPKHGVMAWIKRYW